MFALFIRWSYLPIDLPRAARSPNFVPDISIGPLHYAFGKSIVGMPCGEQGSWIGKIGHRGALPRRALL